MAEYEPATAGTETSLLDVLAQTFEGHVRGSLNELADRVKITAVQKGIGG